VSADPSAWLRGESLRSLEELAEDLRQEIVRTCLSQGGHLGASLGTVELGIALHRVFESPSEPIVWDVGHQAYVHKLLTGRRDRFHSLRQYGGISGFLSRSESDHDVFGAGHSSTSLSAALAFAWARRGTDRWTTAVIGDGGLTAGMAWEALQQVSAIESGPLLIVINDNQMSIGPNVGAIPRILTGERVRELFGEFGLEAVGTVDGHRLSELLPILEKIKRGEHGPRVVLHVLTQKGKGYFPAEEAPETFHGVSPVQSSDKTPGPAGQPAETFSSVAGKVLLDLAEQNSAIVALTAAMAEGTGLLPFSKKFPARFFDVGIAEQHAVTFAAALAATGSLPVLALYSTFLQRGYDQLIQDVALQGLPVTFLVDRAGLVGQDGPTHHGAFDLAYLSAIPNLELVAPSSARELETTLRARFAGRDRPRNPMAIRYPRGKAPLTEAVTPEGLCSDAQVGDVLLISVGASRDRCCAALALLSPEERVRVGFMGWTQLAPVQTNVREALLSGRFRRALIVEDGSKAHGVGAALLAELSGRCSGEVLGFPHRFITHGLVPELEREIGLGREGILAAIRGELEGLRG
jgi:1-deoxy-D-xylulose-5-phosphate synthase